MRPPSRASVKKVFLQSQTILSEPSEGNFKKVLVGKDQEKAQSEKDSHSKNRGRKNQTNNKVLIP